MHWGHQSTTGHGRLLIVSLSPIWVWYEYRGGLLHKVLSVYSSCHVMRAFSPVSCLVRKTTYFENEFNMEETHDIA